TPTCTHSSQSHTPIPTFHLISCNPRHHPRPTLFPYTTLFRSKGAMPPLVLAVDDCRAEYTRLQKLGVEFTQEPVNRYGNVDAGRSEEHTSELQSHLNLVCRLLLEKKKAISQSTYTYCNSTDIR